ncbi:MAG: methyltransferase domain-containing protein [Candidatus Cloacimonetes bacterium]|nr:methyltransferase domain-containing protein [Candidatus Cloacimonadota bacterium]
MFAALNKYCNGNVLDVGGGDFYKTAKKKNLNFDSWITLEPSTEDKPKIKDARFRFVAGDGCQMPFEGSKFDTVLCIQVLEHVFKPIKMVAEISRVLKPQGHAVFLIPQTATLHLAPYHYHNFTRFWIKEVMQHADLKILQLKPLGGIWSSTASHLFYFFLQSMRFKTMSAKECERNIFFYLLYPIMVLYAVISIPICLLFSLGDLSEEPNNHLVVVQKQYKIKA